MEVIPIIFDANRPGKNDSGHPDYGSTGLMWPWGFEQTSQGLGSRSAFNSGKALAGVLGVTVAEQKQGDITALALAKQHGQFHFASSSGFTESDRDLLRDIPTTGEMGQALTSTVALVNEHADENKQEIIDAIDGGSGSASPSNYTLSLNIDTVPGTASGTATPA